MAIFFHTIDVDPHLKHKTALKRWINLCVLAENKTTSFFAPMTICWR